MLQQRILQIALLVVAVSLMSGCASPYSKNYVAEVPASSLGSAPSTTLKVTPKIVKSSHIRADILRLRAEGYVIVGHSEFQAISNAMFVGPTKQAKAVGADIVLLKTKDLGTTQLPNFLAVVVTGTDKDGNNVCESQWIDGGSYETIKYVAVFLRRQ